MYVVPCEVASIRIAQTCVAGKKKDVSNRSQSHLFGRNLHRLNGRQFLSSQEYHTLRRIFQLRLVVFKGTISVITLLVTPPDRKSTRLNSSHQIISYAVFC